MCLHIRVLFVSIWCLGLVVDIYFHSVRFQLEIVANKMSVAEEKAKIEFYNLLNRMNRKNEIIQLKWLNEKLCEIKFRTQIPETSDDFNQLCDDWVELFSDVTNTVWAKKISNTGPKIRFRKQYQCWTHGGKIIQKELLFDARRCKGTLDIKVLTVNSFTIRKNKHIRQGLNAVVKLIFSHLHPVDTTKSEAFFVHTCEPLPEPPPTNIQPNDRIPQMVADIIQKNQTNPQKQRNDTTKSKDNNSEPLYPTNLVQNSQEKPTESQQFLLNKTGESHNVHLLETAQQQQQTQEIQQVQEQYSSNIQPQTIQLVQNIPIQTVDGIKFELAPHLPPQYTQVVVGGDIPEPLLMCQSFMFDTSQVIPVSNQNLSSHFVQIHTQNYPNQ